MTIDIETLLVDRRRKNVTMWAVNLPFISGSKTATFMQFGAITTAT
jgi:hypothetical protein